MVVSREGAAALGDPLVSVTGAGDGIFPFLGLVLLDLVPVLGPKNSSDVGDCFFPPLDRLPAPRELLVALLLAMVDYLEFNSFLFTKTVFISLNSSQED